jgi:hypothetical protein
VILRAPVKYTRGVKEYVVLLVYGAGIFILTSQDCSEAAPPISSEPAGESGPESAQSYPKRLANNNNNTEADTVETATFFEDAPVKSVQVPGMISLGKTFGDTVMDPRSHDIVNFLKRPILCRTGVWSITDATNSILTTMVMPADCLSKPLYREKLRGFYGFRAKMVIRVQINAQRFQQGRLLLHYLPSAVTANTQRTSTAQCCLALKTQQPCIDLDCVDSEVIMEVPYTSMALYFNLLSGENPYGSFYLSVYSPLISPTGLTTVDYSIWCHFEDVEVAYPTAGLAAGPLMPQSGIRSRKKNPSDAEIDSVGLGPISGLANKVSVASGILSEIPLLSSVSAPLSWVAGVVSRSAMALGFSKPTALAPSHKQQLVMFSSLANVDGVDNSQKLSLTSTSGIEMLPGFAGNDLDEMSFAYLMKIPSYVTSTAWTANNSTQTRLFHYRVSPGTPSGTALYQIFSFAGPSSSTYLAKARAPYQYLANLFTYWRGSINFKFKFVKTEFHSGRLLVVFTPGKNIADADCTFDNSQYCFREIIDLRSSNEYSVNIPYVSTTPYMPMTHWSGCLSVYVLNELRCPDTVSNSIQILLETSAGEDMDYCYPAYTSDRPALYSQSGGIVAAQVLGDDTDPDVNIESVSSALAMSGEIDSYVPDLLPIYPQSLGTDEAEANSSATVQPSASSIDGSTPNVNLNANRFISGEKIMSTRQMIKRSTCWLSGMGSTSATSTLQVIPEHLTLPFFKATLAPVLQAGIYIDVLSHIGCMYALQRGGQRIKFISDMTPGTTTMASLCYQLPISNGVPMYSGPALDLNQKNTTTVLETASQFGALEVEIPYTSYGHAKPIGYLGAGFAPPIENTGTSTLLINQSTGTNKNMRLYRAGSDDLSYGFFIGCPLLVPASYVPYSPSTNWP